MALHHQDKDACVYSAAYSADGEWILTTAGDDKVRIWDANSHQQLTAFHIPHLHKAALSMDRKRFVTSLMYTGEQGVIWDVATGAKLVVLKLRGDDLSSAVFNSDGTRVLTGSYSATARIWDSESGDELMVLPGGEHSSHDAVFSPDEKRALTVGCSEVRVWDIT